MLLPTRRDAEAIRVAERLRLVSAVAVRNWFITSETHYTITVPHALTVMPTDSMTLWPDLRNGRGNG